MMAGVAKLEVADAVLLRYLLGALPVDEAEPIEEASLVDGALAARLNALECDLVDEYVRGEMEGPNLARFQSGYLSSPLRAQKVEVAPALSYGKASAGAISSGSRLGMFRAWPMLGIVSAAAVLILIVALGFLTSRNKRLRNEVAETKKQTTELTAKLNEEHAAANSSAQKNGA